MQGPLLSQCRIMNLQKYKIWTLLNYFSIPLTRLQGFSQWRHGGIHVGWVKGHACLHHQDAAVAHGVVHALSLPDGDRYNDIYFTKRNENNTIGL